MICSLGKCEQYLVSCADNIIRLFAFDFCAWYLTWAAPSSKNINNTNGKVIAGSIWHKSRIKTFYSRQTQKSVLHQDFLIASWFPGNRACDVPIKPPSLLIKESKTKLTSHAVLTIFQPRPTNSEWYFVKVYDSSMFGLFPGVENSTPRFSHACQFWHSHWRVGERWRKTCDSYNEIAGFFPLILKWCVTRFYHCF